MTVTTRTASLSLALALGLGAPALAHDTEYRHGHMGRSEIRQAQEKLDELGYPIGDADGVMGPKTATAVRNFQRDKGINATGELNEATLEALNEGRSATSGTREPH
jgi:peptidoglycan hydrolase-like protein with peptidoglycan-binding domain